MSIKNGQIAVIWELNKKKLRRRCTEYIDFVFPATTRVYAGLLQYVSQNTIKMILSYSKGVSGAYKLRFLVLSYPFIALNKADFIMNQVKVLCPEV